jgi:hypothetical protein
MFNKQVKGVGVLQLFADFTARGKVTFKELVPREDFEYVISDPVAFTSFINARINNAFIKVEVSDKTEDYECGHTAPLFDIVSSDPLVSKAFFRSDSIGVLNWLEGAICASHILGGAISDMNKLNITGNLD